MESITRSVLLHLRICFFLRWYIFQREEKINTRSLVNVLKNWDFKNYFIDWHLKVQIAPCNELTRKHPKNSLLWFVKWLQIFFYPLKVTKLLPKLYFYNKRSRRHKSFWSSSLTSFSILWLLKIMANKKYVYTHKILACN